VTSLPARLTTLQLPSCDVCGALDWRRLPAQLRALDVDNNRISGELRLDALPPTLSRLSARSNRLTGSIDLAELRSASSLAHVSLSNNQLSGVVDCAPLAQLPQLRRLYLYDNPFVKLANFAALEHAHGLLVLSLSGCRLEGEVTIDATKLPPSFVLRLFGNARLTGTVITQPGSRARVEFHNSGLRERDIGETAPSADPVEY
jgi:hypothetical protein